jgi:tRNA (guanine10-N2)-dimethyltransferase
MHIISISKLNIKLALAEIKSVLGFEEYILIDRFLLIDDMYYDFNNLNKLAYTKYSYKLLFVSSIEKLLENVKNFNFNTIINKSYKTTYVNLNDEDLGKRINNTIWHDLEMPKVDLINPSQRLYFIATDIKENVLKTNNLSGELKIFWESNFESKVNDRENNKIVFCGIREFESNDNFEDRLPHKRTGLKPISLHPRLARCLVNMLNTNNDIIIDPFCGISGILLEAVLINHKVKGYDISDEMLSISKHSFDEFKINKKLYDFKNKNFFENDEKTKYIVTDLPYGKNTTNLADGFYLDFLKHLDLILQNKAVVVFPSSVQVEQIFNMHNFENIVLKESFEYYIHKSMTKLICVIEFKK